MKCHTDYIYYTLSSENPHPQHCKSLLVIPVYSVVTIHQMQTQRKYRREMRGGFIDILF